MTENMTATCSPQVLSQEDILAAMGEIPGYLDITPGDFEQVYRAAFRHALQRLEQGRTAEQIMRRPVFCAAPGDTLARAAGIMAENRVSGLPVVEESGRVLGVVSERDIMAAMGVKPGEGFMSLLAACLANPKCMAAPLRGATVGELMSRPAITVSGASTAGVMARLMTDHQLNRLPVVDSRGVLRGIVGRGDLLSSLSTGGTR